MDETHNNKSKFQQILEAIEHKMFDIVLELLQDKKIGNWYSCFLMLITFIQFMGYLFDSKNDFGWQDGDLLEIFVQVCQYVRILPAIEENKSSAFFWLLYFFGISVILIIILLLIYMIYSSSNNKLYVGWIVALLKETLLLTFWILYGPLMEVYIGIFKCSDGYHKIVTTMSCYDGIHILYVILSILFVLILLAIVILYSIFFIETNPSGEHAFAKISDNTELILCVTRLVIIIYSTFINHNIGNWVLVCAYILGNLLITYNYFVSIPYFDVFTSTFYGTLVCSSCWISINALLMLIIEVYGHITIICIGLPVIAGMVYNLRLRRVKHILLLSIDKINTDVKALTQITMIQQTINNSIHDKVENVILIGIINLHVLECQDFNCCCKSDAELFDPDTGKFLQHDVWYHKSVTFLHHFNKRLYENALDKFSSSALLHIAFSHFLFNVMKNTHAALLELNIAERKTSLLKQQFMIYRQKTVIENHIKFEWKLTKSAYNQLIYVTEFEHLMEECQRLIEKVANLQLEFWMQVTNQVPDFNCLYNLINKIHGATMEAEEAWKRLCEINPNYPRALTLYGNYMLEIRNNNSVAFGLLEKAKQSNVNKSLDELAKSSAILFADDTAVIHISGKKENPGIILKASRGLTKVFSYNKSEIIGHTMNILMPTFIGKRHNEFLDEFFKTGRKTLFNVKRILYGLNRNGFCFCINLLVKSMPSLDEGIQYVGMIRQAQTDYEYILTDAKGVIQCLSQGITSLLGLPATLFKEIDTNIQVLAPELIKVFSSSNKEKSLLNEFQGLNEHKLTFIIPKNFSCQTQAGNRKNTKGNDLDSSYKKAPIYTEVNKNLNGKEGIANMKITPQTLIQSCEYRDYETKQTVKCEIIDCTYAKDHKGIHPLKFKVFRITRINTKQINSDIDESSDYCEDTLSNVSAELKEFKEDQIKKEELTSLKTNRENINTLGSQMKNESQNMEDSKSTEQLQENAITSEGRIETIEIKPQTNLPFLLKNCSEEGKCNVEEQKNKHVEGWSKSHFHIEPKNSSEKEQKVNNSEELKESESTPKIDIGMIQTPEFNMAEQESSNKQDKNVSSDNIDNEKADKKETNTMKRHSHLSNNKNVGNIEIQKQNNKVDNVVNDQSNIGMNKNNKLFREQSCKKIHHGKICNPAYAKSFTKIRFNTGNQDINSRKYSEDGNLKINDPKVELSLDTTEEKAIEDVDVGEWKTSMTQGLLKRCSRLRGDFIQRSQVQDDKKKLIIDNNGLLRSLKSRIITDPNTTAYPEYKYTEEEIKLRQALTKFNNNNKDKSKDLKDKEKVSENKVEEKAEEEKESEEDDKDNEKEKETAEEIDNTQDAQSSIASSTGSTMYAFHSLRAAIDEKFVPPLIRKMNHAGKIVFLIILGLAISCYVVTFALNGNLKDAIDVIHDSELRLRNLLSINLHVVDMMIISADYNQHMIYGIPESEPSFIKDPLTVTTVAFEEHKKQLILEANSLKTVQTRLSIKVKEMPAETRASINPEDITLYFMTMPEMPVMNNYTMWQTTIEAVIAGLRIAILPITSVNETTDSYVYFLMNNSANGIVYAMGGTVGGIMENVDSKRNLNELVFMILLIVASVVLLLSIILLIPIVNKVNKNKQGVLELFMHMKKSSAKDELKRCWKFLGAFQPNQELELIAGEEKDEMKEDEDEVDAKNKKINKVDKDKDYGMSRRKFKKLTLNLNLVHFKFIFIILIMEGYFILNYLLSTSFLKQVTSMNDEAYLIIEKYSVYAFFLLAEKYCIEKLIIFKNYNLTLMMEDPVECFVAFYNDYFYKEDLLVDTFSRNYDYHSDDYKDKFNDIVFSNICEYVPELAENKETCEAFSHGILKQGIYSTAIKFWDYTRQLQVNFYNIPERTALDQYNYLNSDELVMADGLLSKYVRIALEILEDCISQNISEFFNNEKLQNDIIFGFYICFLVIVYVLFWWRFILEMQKEFWKVKSILCVLSPDLIMNIPEIKTFILDNSSVVSFSRDNNK